MKTKYKILSTIVVFFLLVAFNGPRDNPTVPYIIYTVDNVKKFLEIGAADQQLVVNPSATGFTWTDPGGLTSNSVDSTHIINGGISLDDITGSGITDGALLSYDALNGWGGTTDPVLTGFGATGRVGYYTGTQSLGNESNFSYDATTDLLQTGKTSAYSQSGATSSSTAATILTSHASGSQDVFDAGAVYLRQALGTQSSPSDVTLNNVRMGGVIGQAYYGSGYRNAAGIIFQGAGVTPTGANYSGTISLRTSDGTANYSERVFISHDGQVKYNNYTSSSAFPGTTSHFVTQNSSGEFLTKGAAAMMAELITGNIDLESNRITGLANAQVSSDAVNKTQLDSLGTVLSNSHALDIIAGTDGDTIVLDTRETLLVLDGALGDPATFYIDGSALSSGAKLYIKYGGFSGNATIDRDDDNDSGNFLGVSTTSGSTTLTYSGTGFSCLLKSGATWYEMY